MTANRQRTTLMTKSTLVTVSHAIERAAVAAAEDAPMVVFGLFQRGAYFERERAMYSRIAVQADATVVGVVATAPVLPPPGAQVVSFDEYDPLSREWTVVVLTPRFGAALVAYDREEVAPGAVTLEAGRLFDGRWHFRRDEALHEAIRLRRLLADRLPATTAAAIDGVVDRARYLPGTAGEVRAEASIRLLADRLERLRQHTPPVRPEQADGQVTIGGETELRVWTGADGTTASGTLPLALLALRLTGTDELPGRFGRRATGVATLEVIRVATAHLRPVDRLIRLADDELLLILPAARHDDAVAVAYRLADEVAALAARQPFVPGVTAAVLVTRQRPLPLELLRDGLRQAVAEGHPVVSLGDSERLAPHTARGVATA